jgi:signal transduction histidine kinase
MNELVVALSNDVTSLLNNAYACRSFNLKESVSLAQKALAISRQANNYSLIGKSLNQLSLFYMIRGEHKLAIRSAKEAIEYFQALKDERGIADAQYTIGGVYYRTDNYHLGLINLVNSLVIYRKYNDHYNQARAQKSVGTIYEYFGDQKNAVRAYEAAIDSAKKIKDDDLIANAFNPLSGIYLKQNKIVKALALAERSIAIKLQSGDLRGLAFALYARGKVHIAMQQWAEGEADLLKSLSIHKKMGEHLGRGMAYCKLGTLYIHTGELTKAKQYLNKALMYSTRYKMVYIKFKANFQLYRLYKLEQDTVRALQYLEQYLKDKETVINTQTLRVIENYELVTKVEALEKAAHLDLERRQILENQARMEHAGQMKQNFLSTMSHEIRTPLNAVITITSLLSERVEEEEMQLLDSLKFASNNLLMIINDILDFNKLDNGKVELVNRPCNLMKLLEGLSEAYNNMAKAKGLKLELQIDENLAEAYSLDETKLSQILNNLISNAIKFTDTGSVTVALKLISSQLETDTLRFSVTDTGVGIPEDFVKDMFDSFSQPVAVTTRKQGGSGLGLAIVKRLVELYGSKIYFDTTVNKGSSFYFNIDLKQITKLKHAPVKTLDQLQNKTVLLADDNMINAMVARKLLSKWGLTAEHAINGLVAVEMAGLKAYDFVLMDIHMPEMNGFDATEHIRNSFNPNNSTPIFALTADITAENDSQYAQYFTGFLRKPIEIDNLYEALLAAC